MATSELTFGRYEIRGTLGEGGFAAVYRAWDPGLEREVALKALLPLLAADAEIARRFSAEARALARLHHPNIVPVYDTGQEGGRPFFTMRLIEGPTLAGLVTPGQGMALGQLLPIVTSLASAIDYLHSAGLVHRDIKPSNVMLDPSGVVVLMDLGIARSLDATQQTRTGLSLGTPAYMSPEQVRGERVGPAADIYALGVLTYHLLAGRPPFVGDTPFVMHAHVYEPPPPLRDLRPGLPEPVYAAVAAALAKDPVQRPATAGRFGEATSAGGSVQMPVSRGHSAPTTEPAPTARLDGNVSRRPAASWGGRPVVSYAGLRRRLLALLIDCLVVASLAALAVMVLVVVDFFVRSL